ncbi:protein FAR1-RELATED SEQUENCE [Trifolium repens]|nr:protein FAR1-RELATED SEQUENCE [Trifolium repens]
MENSGVALATLCLYVDLPMVPTKNNIYTLTTSAYATLCFPRPPPPHRPLLHLDGFSDPNPGPIYILITAIADAKVQSQNNKLPYHLCTLHFSICLLLNPNSTISLSIPFSINASIPELGIMIVKEHPVGTELVMSNAIGDEEIDFSCDPYIGLEFFNADDALKFYISYANRMGFKVRIGQLYRSRTNGSVSSRRYVCSKEGHQLSSRTGCPAFIRVQLNDSGKWVVDHFHKDHNHSLENESENFDPTLQSNGATAIDSPTTEVTRRPRKKKLEVANDEPICPFGVIDFKRLRKEELEGQARIEPHVGQEFNTPNEAYQFYHAHAAYLGFGIRIGQLFRSKNDGLITSRRFVCSKEGFQHPSRVGCKAYLRIKRQPSGKWVVDRLEKDHNHDLGLEKEHKTKTLPASNILNEETWLRAMSGRQPLSVIADQDVPIQRAIAKVFPVTYHRFSLWQINAKEQELAGLMGNGFTKDYEKCVYQSQTVDEFDTAWNALLIKYGLKDNTWLNEMYEKRASWVPFYLKGTFCAGIPMKESMESFFGGLLNGQTPIAEFIPRYERGLERRREGERKEDFDTSNFQPFLQTKEPMEEQCRRLYTLAIFKVFQKELLQCYSYLGFKIYEEGPLSRYLVRKCGHDDMEKYVVTFNASNLDISCSCQMFEYEGVLCRHVLRVFQILELREVPSRYILHRWTRNAEDGVFPDRESWSSSQELKSLMLWSLRETASKYIDAGASSIEKYKLAYEILREGGRKLCWHR